MKIHLNLGFSQIMRGINVKFNEIIFYFTRQKIDSNVPMSETDIFTHEIRIQFDKAI